MEWEGLAHSGRRTDTVGGVELFGENFYSDVLDYKDSKDEELSFMDELESSLF